jgi:uncharacterized protein YrrD
MIATAVAAMISAPAWSASDKAPSSPDQETPTSSQSMVTPSENIDSWTVAGASRARASGNLLYSRTPDELHDIEVFGPDGKSIGKITAVAMERSRADVHAVISSGGVLGIGSREIAVPLAELELVEDDKVQSSLTSKAAAARPEFKQEHFGIMESGRPISDFSAFEPTMSVMQQTSGNAAVASRRAGRQSASIAAQEQNRLAEQVEAVENPLHLLTPKEMHGMEVIGSDRETIGTVKAIMGSRDSGQVHAVIASGGFLGIGTRDILVPLNELKTASNGRLQAEFGQEAVKARPQYHFPEFGELASDRPISEFFALESSQVGNESIVSRWWPVLSN